jgi:hypothetical protein
MTAPRLLCRGFLQPSHDGPPRQTHRPAASPATHPNHRPPSHSTAATTTQADTTTGPPPKTSQILSNPGHSPEPATNRNHLSRFSPEQRAHDGVLRPFRALRTGPAKPNRNPQRPTRHTTFRDTPGHSPYFREGNPGRRTRSAPADQPFNVEILHPMEIQHVSRTCFLSARCRVSTKRGVSTLFAAMKSIP